MISGEELAAALPDQPVRDFGEAIDAPKVASGKVREIYDLGESLLMVSTDRISAFDVVLPGGIPGRGMILTQLSHYWFEHTGHIIPNHILPEQTIILRNQLGLSRDGELRSMVVRKLKPLAIECVVRGYLAGSGWSSYRKEGHVCGVRLPSGLEQASQLPQPIFTPTTKAQAGHDLPVTEEKAAQIVGEEIYEKARAASFALYQHGHKQAEKAGILLADTKFEFGLDEAGQLFLIDEAMTPDSSRYWDAAAYRTGISPESFDKQIIRDYLEALDWDKTAPGPELPAEIVERAQQRYLEVYQRIVAA